MIRRVCLPVLLGLLLVVFTGLEQFGWATELPPAVMTYLREKDSKVKVRFDGLVTFSGGQVYLPIIPQDPSLPPNPSRVIFEEAGEGFYPNLVQFDNNFFLIRLVNTVSGKLTLAKMDVYPVAMKEGLLPQDLLLPPNLYMPLELKVLLGDLPYKPQPAPDLAKTPAAIAKQQFTQSSNPQGVRKTLYLNNIDEQTLVAVDPDTERKREEIQLLCVASQVVASVDGKSVYATCLTTDELVVVDTHSNLIKSRVPVGSKPTGMIELPDEDKIIVSHRFSNFLSLINREELTPGSKVLLPGNGGEMVFSPATHSLYVSDYSAGKVYELDLTTLKVTRSLPGMKNMTALWVDERNPKAPMLWMASRTSKSITVLDLVTGMPVRSVEVGQKPLGLAGVINDTEALLYVVCGSDNKLVAVDLDEMKVVDAVEMMPGTFPTAMVVSPKDRRAYVSTAGSNSLVVVDLITKVVENTISVSLRGMGVAMVGADTAPVRQTSTLTKPNSGQKPVEALKPLILKESNSGPSPSALSGQTAPPAVGPAYTAGSRNDTAGDDLTHIVLEDEEEPEEKHPHPIHGVTLDDSAERAAAANASPVEVPETEAEPTTTGKKLKGFFKKREKSAKQEVSPPSKGSEVPVVQEGAPSKAAKAEPKGPEPASSTVDSLFDMMDPEAPQNQTGFDLEQEPLDEDEPTPYNMGGF